MVFATRWVSLCVLLLLISILIQPVERAFAQEAVAETASEPNVVEEVVPEPDPEPEVVEEEPEPAAEEVEETLDEVAVTADEEMHTDNEVSVDDESNDVAGESSDEPTTDVTTEEVATEVPGGNVTEETADSKATTSTSEAADTTETLEEADDTDSSGSGGSSSDTNSEDSATSTDETNATSTDDGSEEQATTTDETAVTESAPQTVVVEDEVLNELGDSEEKVVEETDTTTDESGAKVETTEATTTASTTVNTTPEPTYIIESLDANKPYQFSEGECVLVDDGSYYCSKNTGTPDLDADRIYAAQDTDGDMEIFTHLNGRTEQLTHNLVDDAAPEYDALSERIVWHRLKDGRYRIVVYDLNEHEELELTSGQFNSMEPTAQGDYIAWQAWDGSDWEVMLFDGETTIALSDNNAPDIAPSIHDGYVMWTTTGANGEHAAKVYDISSGATEVIEGTDGGAIRNPRFVLVYDTQYENGDVITQGFDLESGAIASLAALPAELPSDIPDPEPTDEARALITTKSSKEELDEVDVIPNPTPDPEPTTASSSDDIVVEPVNTDTDVDEDEATASTTEAVVLEGEPFELTEYDVVVPEFSTTSQQATVSTTTENPVE